MENAKRLGLEWTMTLATITSADPVEGVVDGTQQLLAWLQ